MYIYGLIDPRDGQLRYVGFTSQSLKRRLQLHKTEAVSKNKRTHKNNWLRLLYNNNYIPDIFVIQETSAHSWQDDERFYIEYFRSIGCDLTNEGLGGEGNTAKTRTPEFKDKVSKKLTGRIFTPEHKANLSISNIGNKNNLGKKASLAKLAKMSAWQLGKKHPKERIEINRISQGGLSDAQIQELLHLYFISGYTRKDIALMYEKKESSIANYIKRQKSKFGYSTSTKSNRV